MSAGVVQLIAIGAQDKYIMGNPEISFFSSTFKRHANFSQSVEKQTIHGAVKNNSMSSIQFERSGDLLSYVYLHSMTKPKPSIFNDGIPLSIKLSF